MGIYTVGHSTYTIERFLTLTHDINIILDVRSHPTSRWPQFEQASMREWLEHAGKEYVWAPSMGGWTKDHLEKYDEEMSEIGIDLSHYAGEKFPQHHIAKKRLPPYGEPLPVWTSVGLWEYAWYTGTDDFLGAAHQLAQSFGSASEPAVALLCAEALWWACHRSLIADFLAFAGVSCTHLLAGSRSRRLTEHKAALSNRLERYPLPVLATWKDYLDEH